MNIQYQDNIEKNSIFDYDNNGSGDFIDSSNISIDIKKVIDECGEDGYSIPKINMKDCETHVFIEVEMPGIPKRNIKMELDNNFLEIRGYTDDDATTYNGYPIKYIRKERIQGKFKRTIELPCKVDTASASYHEGIVYIELTKPDETQHKGKRQIKLY